MDLSGPTHSARSCGFGPACWYRQRVLPKYLTVLNAHKKKKWKKKKDFSGCENAYQFDAEKKTKEYVYLSRIGRLWQQ